MQHLPTKEATARLRLLEAQFQKERADSCGYDLRRGRPSIEQLDLIAGLDGCLKGDYRTLSGLDTRIYGQDRYGIAEARKLFSDILGTHPEQTLVYGNSSLQLIYFCMLFAWLHGVSEDSMPWSQHAKKHEAPQFLCPVPGYDRHFAICETLGISMQAVAMNADGPDMDAVEEMVRNPRVKGMLCVPRFSNPSGIVYSDDTVERIARLGLIAAPDFRVLWDNAYAVHELHADATKLRPIMPLCEKYSTEDMLWLFFSTSKVSLSGAGIAGMASSKQNIEYMARQLSITSIGSDRVNQLRHMRVFPDAQSIYQHMALHAKILMPKFKLVERVLRDNLPTDKTQGYWSKPQGGYFTLFYAPAGHASEIAQVCKEMKVLITPAGITHPYRKDPEDSMLRLAPTALALEELEHAMRRFALAVQLVCARRACALAAS